MRFILKTIIFAWALATLWFSYTRMLADPGFQTISTFGWLFVAVGLLVWIWAKSFWMKLIVLTPVVAIGVSAGLSFASV